MQGCRRKWVRAPCGSGCNRPVALLFCGGGVVGWWGGCGRGFAPASVRSPAVTLLARKGRQAGCQPDEERYASRR